MKLRDFLFLLALFFASPCFAQDMKTNVLSDKTIEIGPENTYVRDSYTLFIVYAEKSDLKITRIKLFNVTALKAFDDLGKLEVLDNTIKLRNPLGNGILQAKFTTEYYVEKPNKIDDHYKFIYQIKKPELITNKPEVILRPNFYLKSMRIILPPSTVFYVYPSKDPAKIKNRVELNWGPNEVDKEIILEFGNIELAVQAETEIKLMEEELNDMKEKYHESSKYLDVTRLKKNLDLVESKLMEAIRAYDEGDFSTSLEKTSACKFFLESAKNLLDKTQKDYIEKLSENITEKLAFAENKINSIEKTGTDVEEAKIYLKAAKQKLEDIDVYKDSNPNHALLLAEEAIDNLNLAINSAEKAEKKKFERMQEENIEKRTRLLFNLTLFFILLLIYMGLKIWR
ncbi:MAG: coiled-coil domain-containing protein [Candidatus Hydrothermarchaeota archaeon]